MRRMLTRREDYCSLDIANVAQSSAGSVQAMHVLFLGTVLPLLQQQLGIILSNLPRYEWMMCGDDFFVDC